MAKRNVISIGNKKQTTFNQLNLIKAKPLTKNQHKFFSIFDSSNFMMLNGVAGTGKTWISLYKALEDVMKYDSKHDKVVLIRSAVSSRDIGYLPGDEKEKSEVYQRPYYQICSELFNSQDVYKRLKERHIIEFELTSFLRGNTIHDAIIIVDECQNMNFNELNTIMTRIGEETKIVFCGDFNQIDLSKKNDISGLGDFLEICNSMKSFKNIEFNIDDIVRSELVKEYIIAALNYKESKL